MNLKQQKSSKLHALQLSKQSTCRHFPIAICPQIIFFPDPLPDHSWPPHMHTPKRKGIFLCKRLEPPTSQQINNPHMDSTHSKSKFINLKPRSLSKSKMQLQKEQFLESNQSTQLKTVSQGFFTGRSYITKQDVRQQKLVQLAPKSLIIQKYPVKQNKISIYQGRAQEKISYLSQSQMKECLNIRFVNASENLSNSKPSLFERSAVSTGLSSYRFMSKSNTSQAIIPSSNVQIQLTNKQSPWKVLKRQIRQFKEHSPDKESQETTSDPNSFDSIRVSNDIQRLEQAREVNTIVSDDCSGAQAQQSKISSREDIQPLKVSMVIGNDINQAGFWD